MGSVLGLGGSGFRGFLGASLGFRVTWGVLCPIFGSGAP